MPEFFYKAKKGPQGLEEGIIEAETESAAISKLTQKGFSPISLSLKVEGRREKIRWVVGKKVSHRELVTFTQQLSNLLESGLTLYRALTVLERQTEDRRLQAVIRDIADLVKEGKSLSESLGRYPRVFNNMYISMVKTGELSGTLEKVLRRLADFGEKQEDIKGKVQAAMAYPALMAIVGTATIIVLFTFVIPRLIGLFEDMQQVLPLPTRIMIGISNLFLNFWWLILAAGAFCFFAFRRNLFSTKGKLAIDRFKLGLPIWGKFFKRVQVANFSRTLGTLLGNGVPILPAMKSVSEILQSETLKEELKRIADEIREGSSLARGISKSEYFPALMANMTAIGEEGGRLEDTLLRVAKAYEKETEQSIKLLTSLIEPVMILVMGSIVGFIVISMLLPIFQISLIAQ